METNLNCMLNMTRLKRSCLYLSSSLQFPQILVLGKLKILKVLNYSIAIKGTKTGKISKLNKQMCDFLKIYLFSLHSFTIILIEFFMSKQCFVPGYMA